MPEWVLSLLTIFLGGGGLITAIVAWRRDNRDGPVEAQTAQVADAVALSNAAGGLVKIVLDHQKVQDGRIAATEHTIRGLQTKVDAWTLWYSDLAVRWPHHRAQDKPPPPPHVAWIKLDGGTTT